jgi:hypothetical protein
MLFEMERADRSVSRLISGRSLHFARVNIRRQSTDTATARCHTLRSLKSSMPTTLPDSAKSRHPNTSPAIFSPPRTRKSQSTMQFRTPQFRTPQFRSSAVRSSAVPQFRTPQSLISPAPSPHQNESPPIDLPQQPTAPPSSGEPTSADPLPRSQPRSTYTAQILVLPSWVVRHRLQRRLLPSRSVPYQSGSVHDDPPCRTPE